MTESHPKIQEIFILVFTVPNRDMGLLNCFVLFCFVFSFLVLCIFIFSTFLLPTETSNTMASRAYIKICLNSEEIVNRPDMT